MKVKTIEQLSDILDHDLSRRRSELHSFRTLIRSETRPIFQKPLLRAGVTLLYAHWEGFIKSAASAYLSFVDEQKPTYAELVPSLLGLALRGAFGEAYKNEKNHASRTKVVRLIVDGAGIQAKLPSNKVFGDQDEEGAIRSANIKSKVLYDILELLNIDATLYKTKEAVIDGKLLKHRNSIAHGDLSEIGPRDYDEMYQEILDLISLFNNDVQNAATMQRYRRTPNRQAS